MNKSKWKIAGECYLVKKGQFAIGTRTGKNQARVERRDEVERLGLFLLDPLFCFKMIYSLPVFSCFPFGMTGELINSAIVGFHSQLPWNYYYSRYATLQTSWSLSRDATEWKLKARSPRIFIVWHSQSGWITFIKHKIVKPSCKNEVSSNEIQNSVAWIWSYPIASVNSWIWDF